jgi:hypothetical protein
VEADFTGGHLLHLAAAVCVLNDLYREDAALGIELTGARVSAAAGSTPATRRSTDIDYSVEVSSDAPADQLAHLLDVVDQVAEIPQAIRAGATVRRVCRAVPSSPKSSRPVPGDAGRAHHTGRPLARCPPWAGPFPATPGPNPAG